MEVVYSEICIRIYTWRGYDMRSCHGYNIYIYVSDRAIATSAYIFLMLDIFPNIYQKLNQNPITFPLRIQIPIQSLPLRRLQY